MSAVTNSNASNNNYAKYAVLYVDDEEQALKYFRKGLKDFQVLIAPNVAQATEILAREGGRIGVVITDQRMPGQSGTELLARLRRARVVCSDETSVRIDGRTCWNWAEPAKVPAIGRTSSSVKARARAVWAARAAVGHWWRIPTRP